VTERVSAGLATRVLAVSHSILSVMTGFGLCAPSKAAVLLHGTFGGIDATRRFRPADSGRRANDRHALGIPVDATVIGFMGRVVRDKGIVELESAWQTLQRRHPALRLLIVGPVEPQDPVPSDVLQRLRDDPRVTMPGLRFDTPAMYSAMDIAVLPSYREGFGLAALEAGAMGLPVVATNIPGLVDAISDGATGTLIPRGDPVSLANAVEQYIADPALRKRHGGAARQRALTNFEQARVWDALMSEYYRLLGKPRPGRESRSGSKSGSSTGVAA
jgi:glycosyltransferase involved in cell wall biosynthesis